MNSELSTPVATGQAPPAGENGWTRFSAAVSSVTDLSAHLRRITLRGPGLGAMRCSRDDQRFKLVIPAPDGSLDVPEGQGWYAQLRQLPEARRPVARTYTVRAVRPESDELDVDMVLHGASGPASAWASAAVPGDRVLVLGPDARAGVDPGGVEFRRGASQVFLAADETALPAVAAIVESLEDVSGVVLVEVPTSSDIVDLAAPDGMEVRWLPRDGAPVGERLLEEVQRYVNTPTVSERSDSEVSEPLVWDVDGAGAEPTQVWMAAEQGVVKAARAMIRAHLDVPKSACALMGYWRIGVSMG